VCLCLLRHARGRRVHGPDHGGAGAEGTGTDFGPHQGEPCHDQKTRLRGARNTSPAPPEGVWRGLAASEAWSPTTRPLSRFRVAKADAFAESVAPMIRLMRDTGASFAKIAGALNAQHIKTAHGSTWTPMAVKRVLDRSTPFAEPEAKAA